MINLFENPIDTGIKASHNATKGIEMDTDI